MSSTPAAAAHSTTPTATPNNTPSATTTTTTTTTTTASSSNTITDVAQGQFVQKRLTRARDAALGLYSRVEHSNLPLVKFGLDTFEKSTSWLSRPLVHTLSRVGQPVVERLDNSLSVAYVTLDDRILRPAQARLHQVQTKTHDNVVEWKDAVVTSQWMKQVDTILKSAQDSVRQGQARAQVSLRSFTDAAVDAYAALDRKTFEDFAILLRQQLSTWDERYLVPAKVFYASAQERLKNIDLRETGTRSSTQVVEYITAIRESLAQVWEQNTRTAVINARALYDTALEQYLKLAEKQQQQQQQQQLNADGTVKTNHGVSINELVAGVRASLGLAWNDRLVQPLTEFLQAAKLVAVQDLQRLRLSQRAHNASQQVSHSFSGMVDGVYGFVHNRVSDVLNISERTVDYILPAVTTADASSTSATTTSHESEHDNEHDHDHDNDNDNDSDRHNVDQDDTEGESEQQQQQQQPVKKQKQLRSLVTRRVRALGSTVTQRLRQRASNQWSKVREFSATTLQSTIHVDLVAYSEQVLSHAQQRVQSTTSHTTQSLLKALHTAQDALTKIKQSTVGQCQHLTHQTNQRYHQVVQQYVSPYWSQLQQRLRRVAKETQSLASNTMHLIGTRRILKAHEDMMTLAMKSLGLQERDAKFQAYVSQVKHLLESVWHVLVWSDRLDAETSNTSNSTTTTVTYDDDDDSMIDDEHQLSPKEL